MVPTQYAMSTSLDSSSRELNNSLETGCDSLCGDAIQTHTQKQCINARTVWLNMLLEMKNSEVVNKSRFKLENPGELHD